MEQKMVSPAQIPRRWPNLLQQPQLHSLHWKCLAEGVNNNKKRSSSFSHGTREGKCSTGGPISWFETTPTTTASWEIARAHEKRKPPFATSWASLEERHMSFRAVRACIKSYWQATVVYYSWACIWDHQPSQWNQLNGHIDPFSTSICLKMRNL